MVGVTGAEIVYGDWYKSQKSISSWCKNRCILMISPSPPVITSRPSWIGAGVQVSVSFYIFSREVSTEGICRVLCRGLLGMMLFYRRSTVTAA